MVDFNDNLPALRVVFSHVSGFVQTCQQHAKVKAAVTRILCAFTELESSTTRIHVVPVLETRAFVYISSVTLCTRRPSRLYNIGYETLWK